MCLIVSAKWMHAFNIHSILICGEFIFAHCFPWFLLCSVDWIVFVCASLSISVFYMYRGTAQTNRCRNDTWYEAETINNQFNRDQRRIQVKNTNKMRMANYRPFKQINQQQQKWKRHETSSFLSQCLCRFVFNVISNVYCLLCWFISATALSILIVFR